MLILLSGPFRMHGTSPPPSVHVPVAGLRIYTLSCIPDFGSWNPRRLLVSVWYKYRPTLCRNA